MRFLDYTSSDATENLALDEALLIAAENGDGGEALRIWEQPTTAIVLGAASVLNEDVDLAKCLSDGVPILRRSSGGGTVTLGLGCLVYSVVLSYDRSPALRHIGPSYCYIFERLISSLGVPGLGCAGTSDLALNSCKVSGNSQQRKRNHLLHHGTLLYEFDPAIVGRYLRMPSRQPVYRLGRSHGDFLTNVPLERAEIVKRLREAFTAHEELTELPTQLAKSLVATKYALKEWTHRR